MQQRLPERLDPVSLIRNRRQLAGRLSTARMARLTPRLEEQDVELEVELDFGTSEAGTRYIAGRIRGELRLRCERCLEPLRFPVDLDFRLALIESEALADRIPEEFEPLVYAGEPLSLSDLIEDELLLALPMFAVHADEAGCGARQAQSEPEQVAGQRDNPFAVLEKLKRDE
ncbi:YceD family protein [Thiohalobacter sp. IOR34]|uniref:YceD family protein n=1 Tax=Thiohalobacter sp. IOR34 TaxID=3057176 RepID=UPI0025B261E1|nr:YceD family protein [Thiohalobacter sp. IOR34]WJW74243.1 YceD family protein [Thiohalobacter sp. IOR34]